MTINLEIRRCDLEILKSLFIVERYLSDVKKLTYILVVSKIYSNVFENQFRF